MATSGSSGIASCWRKKRYNTEAFATKVVAKVLKDRGQKVRAYGCGICGGYHLTSKPTAVEELDGPKKAKTMNPLHTTRKRKP